MELCIYPSKDALGAAATAWAGDQLQEAIRQRGSDNLILATGASQFEILAHLVTLELDWRKVTAFHLDEYIGLPAEHPASFRKYLRERFEARLPGLGAFHYVNGEAQNPGAECRRLGELIGGFPVDVACIGIGENGHLAFNDPPADFETDQAYLVVDLDDACGLQQVGEGWFASLDDVPRQAISMSIGSCSRSRFRGRASRPSRSPAAIPRVCSATVRHHHREHCCRARVEEPIAGRKERTWPSATQS